MYELMIIGGGPAGMTAAVYSARKKINALFLSQNVGGQVITTSSIENYMGYQLIEGGLLMDKFEEQIKQFPIDRKVGEEASRVLRVEGGFRVETVAGEGWLARAVIVATGKTPRHLNVPGEEKLIGRGVSYCAVCDGPLFEGQAVAVIGGGNSALEAIDDLLKVGTVVYSVTEADFTGDAVLVDRVKSSPKFVPFHHHRVASIGGQEAVAALVIRDNVNGEEKRLDARGVFVEIGLTPASGLVRGLAALNDAGEIIVDCNCRTDVPGLFAAGDVTSTPEKQIIIAAGEGAKAALQAHRYLQRITS